MTLGLIGSAGTAVRGRSQLWTYCFRFSLRQWSNFDGQFIWHFQGSTVQAGGCCNSDWYMTFAGLHRLQRDNRTELELFSALHLKDLFSQTAFQPAASDITSRYRCQLFFQSLSPTVTAWACVQHNILNPELWINSRRHGKPVTESSCIHSPRSTNNFSALGIL